ncbi:MAG: tetratricopeptide repeat protein [Sumerlaeia bacterium]
MLRPKVLAQAILVSVLLFGPPMAASADVVVLSNGNRLEGMIVSETDQFVTLDTEGSQLKLSRSNIRAIERGPSVAFLAGRASRALEAASRQLSSGRRQDALKTVEEALHDLEVGMREVDGEAPELKDKRRELAELRRKALPPDPKKIEADRLLEEAMEHVNFVRLEEAFQTLQKAAALDETSAAIHYHLAKAALAVQREEVATKAYGQVIRLEADTYYTEVSDTYLDLLHKQGRQLLRDRRSDEALAVYEEILLLQANGEDEAPIAVGDFLARRATRGSQPREEVLKEVYRYADSEDLIDLAFVSVSELQRLDPENEEFKRLAEEDGFLARFNRAMEGGKLEEASGLIGQAGDLLKRPRVAAKVKELAGDRARELEASRIAESMREAMKSEDFARAANLAKRVLRDYADMAVAREAGSILKQAELEIPVKTEVDKARAAIADARDDDAEAALKGVAETATAIASVQLPAIKKLMAQIPRERRADELWLLADADLESERFNEALERLEELESDFADTRSGGRAVGWLNDYRARLRAETQRYRPRDTDFLLAITDPNLWRAAAYESGGNGRRELGAVVSEGRSQALASFRGLMRADAGAVVDPRPGWMHVGLPLGLGGLVLLGLLFTLAKPGSGQYAEVIEDDAPPEPGEEGSAASRMILSCRACGQASPAKEPRCPACGTARAMTEDEQIRSEDEKRRADFDPWKLRVSSSVEFNKFNEYYEKARELSETSDVQAALENCRAALRENPHSSLGYELLATLYERMGKQDDAILCYREILLLNPTDQMVRQKLESLSAVPPLDSSKISLWLAALLWWFVYFLMIGVDPGSYVLRAIACLAGFGLTFALFKSMQKHSRLPRVSRDHAGAIDVMRPLPKQTLSWAEQNKQARVLADAILHHTGVEVPVLSVWRLVWALALSLLMLVVLVAVAWVQSAPWVLLAWPAGALLLVWVFELAPRALTAHVLLRHFQEETLSPWSDPHRPFQPAASKTPPIGEFLLESPTLLPLRWTFRPFPYSKSRQGVLNNIQQVLNRHWEFHRFYHEARVVRDLEIPLPAYSKPMNYACGLLIVLALAGALTAYWGQRSAAARYDESMQLGYVYLLDGDVPEALRYFQEAQSLQPSRVAPHLYMGHTFAAKRLAKGAERNFKLASEKNPGIAAVENDYANFLQREGRLREAAEAYLAALEIEPTNPDILNNAGSAFYKLEDYARAVELLKRAVAVDPEHSRAHTTLGLAYEGLGDRDAARQAYEKAVAVAPELSYTQVARNRLDLDLAPIDATPLRLEVASAADSALAPAPTEGTAASP